VVTESAVARPAGSRVYIEGTEAAPDLEHVRAGVVDSVASMVYRRLGPLYLVALAIAPFVIASLFALLITEATRFLLRAPHNLTPRGTQPMKGRDAPVVLWGYR